MKLTRKQFLAALALLASLPTRLLGCPPKSGPGGSDHSGPAEAPRRNGPWLADWRQAQRVPVLESVHPTAQRLILAAWRHEMLRLRYWGGSTPGRQRCISPGLVFQLDGSGPLYVTAFCHLRRAERVFRVDRLEILPADDWIICLTE